MSSIFEIAYAAASGRLCFFTGTGFSKAITNGTAPGWEELLKQACESIDGGERIAEELFPALGKNPLPLEEAAQVIAIEFSRNQKSLHETIAEIINNLSLSGDNSAAVNFLRDESFDVVTTNYDKLFESLINEQSTQSLSPGMPIPRSHSPVRVYHVHGSIDSPENMVVTSDDYFKFLNDTSYFSQKLSTILHENTVVILGYALGDTNLKSILSRYKNFSRTNYLGSSIFFISRAAVPQHIKDYYAHSFGIRVIDNTEVRQFFTLVTLQMSSARACVNSSREDIRNVLHNNYTYNDNYIKTRASFFEIIASISATGINLNSTEVATLVGKIINRKIDFTAQLSAWYQYVHLAEWLSYVCSMLDLRGSSIEATILAATLKSMSSMSSTYALGMSWDAYKIWKREWSNISPSNRALIRSYIQENSSNPDSIALVASA